MNLPVSYHGRGAPKALLCRRCDPSTHGPREIPAPSCCSDIALGATLLIEVRQPALAMGIVGYMAGIVHSFAPSLFQGKTVLVTGGTSGIGLGCAQLFRDLDAGVIATGATEAERDRARTDGVNAGITFEHLDLRDAREIQRLVAGLERLDVLVNAAGVIRRDTEHDPEVFADVIAIHRAVHSMRL